ncbi:archease [bacterium]|nr:archease [bacterium]
MATGYEFFDHTADVGVRISGASLPDLFQQAAAALYAAMGRWVVVADPVVVRHVDLTAGSLEDLLHDWLGELLYDFATDHVVYREWAFRELGPGRLAADLRGGRANYAQSEPRAEIKAVTYHQLTVQRQADGGWLATVIFDV